MELTAKRVENHYNFNTTINTPLARKLRAANANLSTDSVVNRGFDVKSNACNKLEEINNNCEIDSNNNNNNNENKNEKSEISPMRVNNQNNSNLPINNQSKNKFHNNNNNNNSYTRSAISKNMNHTITHTPDKKAKQRRNISMDTDSTSKYTNRYINNKNNTARNFSSMDKKSPHFNNINNFNNTTSFLVKTPNMKKKHKNLVFPQNVKDINLKTVDHVNEKVLVTDTIEFDENSKY